MTVPEPGPETSSVVGGICVVTGASSGIGKAAARALTRLGATVVLVCRDPARGLAALEEVAVVAGPENPPQLEIADLSSLAEVRELAGRLAALDRIDVLVNNAGLTVGERRTTADGLELTFAVNHLAPFLLTTLLVDRLTASAPSRVVTVASRAHHRARLDFDDLQQTRLYSGRRAYANSKLANILFTRELAERLRGSGVTANCLHPGVVATGFAREGGTLDRLGFRLARPFLRSPERGADTVVQLATAPEVAEVSGAYFADRRQITPSAAARDQDSARRLWRLSAELTGTRVS
ncbi:SDR family oxidoreductase [Actinomadura scrupuli]|uniref:SDR family oxidoreductase n=1 Tax=Actinomadura scrupuli TaxID=559629 RepID=UPI003D9658B0